MFTVLRPLPPVGNLLVGRCCAIVVGMPAGVRPLMAFVFATLTFDVLTLLIFGAAFTINSAARAEFAIALLKGGYVLTAAPGGIVTEAMLAFVPATVAAFVPRDIVIRFIGFEIYFDALACACVAND